MKQFTAADNRPKWVKEGADAYIQANRSTYSNYTKCRIVRVTKTQCVVARAVTIHLNDGTPKEVTLTERYYWTAVGNVVTRVGDADKIRKLHLVSEEEGRRAIQARDFRKELEEVQSRAIAALGAIKGPRNVSPQSLEVVIQQLNDIKQELTEVLERDPEN